MPYTQSVTSNNNAAFTSTVNNFVYQNGVSFPTGRINRDGGFPVYVSSVYGGYSSTSADWSIVYSGTETSGGTLFSSSGGTMQVRQYNRGGTMYFGRNTGISGTVIDNFDGEPYSNGALAYSMDYIFVPTAPATITATRDARNITVTATASSDNGSGTISSYRVQQRSSTNGSSWGAWGNEQTLSSFSYTYTNLTPALFYQYRVYAVNQAGNSAAQVSASVFMPAGGKRWNGSTWASTTIARKWNGTAWVDISIAKRWNGTAWIDLS